MGIQFFSEDILVVTLPSQPQQSDEFEALNTMLSEAIDHDVECAGAYFGRGACHYRLGHYRLAEEDIKAAALLGCEDAIFWSK